MAAHQRGWVWGKYLYDFKQRSTQRKTDTRSQRSGHKAKTILQHILRMRFLPFFYD